MELDDPDDPTLQEGAIHPFPSDWLVLSPESPAENTIYRLNLQNWKETPRVVSLQEIQSKSNPRPPQVALDGKYPHFEDYARTHSLLLREECLAPLRRALQAYVEGRKVPSTVPMYGPTLQFERYTPDGTGL